jgi:hypothetical protein
MSNVHAGYELTEVECSKCNMMVNAVEKDHHESKCTGLDILQCPTCHQKFENRHQKAAHKKKYANVDCSTNTIVNSNNITIGTQIIVQGGGDSLRQVLDFASAQNSSYIITHLQGNPAEIQIAHKLGDSTLHQALTAISHYTGPPETRNIVRMDPKNSIAKVVVDGQVARSQINKVLDTTEKRNREIANDPSIKRLLTKDMNAVMLPIPVTDKEWRSQRAAKRNVMQNKGLYDSQVKERIPSVPPPAPIPPKMLATLILEAMDSMNPECLRMVEFNKDLEQALHNVFMLACNQFTFVGNEWWTTVPDNPAWMLCDNTPKLIKDRLHGAQQLAIDKLLSRKQEVPQGPEFNRLRSMSDCLCRFNISPSVQNVIYSIQNPSLTHALAHDKI